MSEIDELGSSLLNRQRDTRKRTEKRLRRDTRNQAVLNIAAKGMQLANSALKNRADTFVNENEDLIGQRVLYKQALGDRQAIIDDYTAGQAYAGGMEEYLVDKFLPDVNQAIGLNIDETKYTGDSVTKLGLEKARAAAKEYMPQFETAYKAALNMPDIDSYDSFVATKTQGKKATNVGGFLINSVLRNINEESTEDTDKQIVDAVLNSRFGDNATAVMNAKKAMDQGYSIGKAERLSKSIEDVEDNGLESIGVKFIKADPVEKEITTYGIKRKVTVMNVTYSLPGGGVVTQVEPFFNFDKETGERIESNVSLNATKDYLAFVAATGNRSFDGIDSITQEDVDNFSKQVQYQPLDPDGTRVTNYGVFGQPGITFSIKAVDINGNLKGVSVDRFVPDEILSEGQKLSKINQKLVDDQQGNFQETLRDTVISTSMFGGQESALQENMVLVAFSGDADVGEKLIDEDRAAIIQSIYDPAMRRLAVDTQNLIEKFSELDETVAMRLTNVAAAQSIKSGLKDNNTQFIQDSTFLNTKDFKNTLMLYGDAVIEETTPGNRLEIPVLVYNDMVIATLDEVEPIENDILNTNRKEARRLLAGAEEFKNHTVPTSKLDIDFSLTHNPDDIISPTGDVRAIHVLEHFDRLEQGLTGDSKVGANKPLELEPSKPISIDDFRGTTVNPKVIDVVTPAVDAIKSGVESGVDAIQSSEAQSKKYRDAIAAYRAEAISQNLTGPEASRYAKAMVDSMGDNITLPK
tara:strand:+ start:886 stop:3132 length:2247 start_codon:yes stop_codon:yes gene_type:complete